MLTSDLGWAGDGAEAAGIQNSLGTNGEDTRRKPCAEPDPAGSKRCCPKTRQCLHPKELTQNRDESWDVLLLPGWHEPPLGTLGDPVHGAQGCHPPVVLPLQHEVLQLLGDPAHELILVGREEHTVHAAQRQGGGGGELGGTGMLEMQT